MRRWNDKQRAQLRELAATGMPASDIGAHFGTSRLSVIIAASHNNIEIVRHTEAEIAEIKANAKVREKRKSDKRKKLKKPVAAAPTEPGASRTHPVYRNQLPRQPEMTKNELRAMLAEAVRNTAGMTA